MCNLGLWGPKARDQEAFEALLEAIGEPAAVLDVQSRVLALNPALRGLLGPASTPAPLAPAARLFAPDAREAVARWLAAGGVAPIESTLAAPEGAEAPVLCCRLRLLPDGRRLLLAEDLSEGRRFRERAEEGERLRAVGQLAGGIAHDFNNLLSVVVAAAEAARQQAPDAAAELDPLLAAADRGAALVRRLLQLAGRQRLEPRVVVLDEALGAMAALLPRLLGPRIRLEMELRAQGRLALVDPTQLDQVVFNLATNAAQAMRGVGRLTIASDTAVALREEPGMPDPLPPGRWSVLSVSDTGPGVSPEVLARMFEPFFTTRSAQGGTGLGLATVHGIVRQSGGVLQVATRLGEGTSFRIFLPRHVAEQARSEETTEPAPAARRPPAAEAADGAASPGADVPLRVLLVDDEAPLRRLSERALAREGMEVRAAEDAEEALEVLSDGFVPEVLVSDVAMPGMDGLALARAAQARLPRLRVVLVSGYAEASLEGRALEPGMAFLAKPYRPAALAALVREKPR